MCEAPRQTPQPLDATSCSACGASRIMACCGFRSTIGGCSIENRRSQGMARRSFEEIKGTVLVRAKSYDGCCVMEHRCMGVSMLCQCVCVCVCCLSGSHRWRQVTTLWCWCWWGRSGGEGEAWMDAGWKLRPWVWPVWDVSHSGPSSPSHPPGHPPSHPPGEGHYYI